MNVQKLKDKAYNYDQTLLKVFGEAENKKIKLIRMNYLKTSGIEFDDIEYVRGTVNENKINENYK